MHTLTLQAYLPKDRLHALARAESLPDRARGSALFADISGFTTLTEKLTREFGVRRGIEALTLRINKVYDAMVGEVDRFEGNVISLAGDSITCWFDEKLVNHAQQAVLCAHALQSVLEQFSDLEVKTAVTTGTVRRFAIGDPDIQLIDTLAGATIARLATAEQLSKPGEIILDQPTSEALQFTELITRASPSGEQFFMVDVAHLRESELIGISLDSNPKPEPRLDKETLQPWILPMVFDKETTGHELLLTELRPTTALFIRFTGIDYDNDPQAWEQLNSIVSNTQRILERHEGSLLELTIGDKGSYLYASFGATHIHEDDPGRAIRAALEIRSQFNTDAPSTSIQIGISSGTMRVGGYGSSSRKSFSALGNEANLAARLMTIATAGQILVSGRIQKAGIAEFAFEPHSPMNIKGWTEPVLVFAVQGPLHRRSIRLGEPTYPLPMIGRRAEMEEISGKLKLASSGKGQIIGITGEAGLGKSRLAAEAIRLANRNSFSGYGGACQSDGTINPYLVWVPIWNAFFDLDLDMPLRKQIRMLEAELEYRAPEYIDALPLLGSILGLSLPENEFTRSLQPADRKSQLETMLVKCLHGAAKQAGQNGGGLLLVLEDLHWVDPVSSDLLVLAARAIQNLPILILLTYRPPDKDATRQTRAPFEVFEHFTEIKLTELDSLESEQAIRAKLAHLFPEHRGGISTILLERIISVSQGNPFYVEELLNYMHDRRIDLADTNMLNALDLPTSLHSLILSRIDHLTSSQQLCLKVASIIGRVFRFEHLHNYHPPVGSADKVKSELQILERLELTPLESPEPELTYLFKHLVTHEVGYESIAFATRAQLHGQYATYLEQTYPNQLDQFSSQLAHHYEKAGIQDKARYYLSKSGGLAAANFANEEALVYFDRALNLAEDKTSRFRFDTLMNRERVYDLMGQREEQRQDIQELAHLANNFDDAVHLRTQLALRLAKLEFDEGNYSAAKTGAQDVIQELNAASQLHSPELLVDALWLEARAMFFAGQAIAAKPQLDSALELARMHGYIRGEYNALAQLGLWNWYNGDNQSAVELLEQSLELIRQAGDVRRELDLLINLGIVTKDMYRFTDSLAYYEQAQRIAKKIGDRAGEASLLNNMGRASFVSGDFVNSIQFCSLSAALAKEVNDTTVQGLALFNQGDAYRSVGQYQRARESMEESLIHLRAAGYRRGVADAMEYLAQIEFSLGNRDRAIDIAEEALLIAREIGARQVEVSLLIRIGIMYLEMGQIEVAQEVFQSTSKTEEEIGDSIPKYEMAGGLARIELSRKDGDSAIKAATLVRELAGELLHEPPTGLSHVMSLSLYLTCMLVMSSTGDPRLVQLIERAKQELQVRSDKITDPGMRSDYLRIPEHRAISDYAANAAIHS